MKTTKNIMAGALKALFVVVVLAACASCSDTRQKEAAKEVQPAPSSKEIVEKYTHTLATAPERATDASDAVAERAAAQEKAVE